MQKKPLLLLIVLLVSSFIVLWIYLISTTGPRYVNGIFVDELLRIVSYEKYKINYCKLLKKATMNDVNSIKKIILLNFDDGTGYYHGYVIIELIEFIGEDKFIHSLEAINKEQKRQIWQSISLGLQYKNSFLEAREIFPKTYVFLN